MTKEIQKTLEGLKEMPDYPLFPERSKTISHAIQILTAHEQAEKELGEKKDVDFECEDGTDATLRSENEGFNKMHNIARLIIANYILREQEQNSFIEKLEETIKTGKCKHIAEDVLSGECSLCHLAWCEGRIKVLDKKILEMNYEAIADGKKIEELESVYRATKEYKDFLKSELQSFKDKLTVEKMRRIVEKANEEYMQSLIESVRTGNKPKYLSRCEAITQALIKELTGKKE